MTKSIWSQETGFSCYRKSSPISWPFYVIGVAGDVANIVTFRVNLKFAKKVPIIYLFKQKKSLKIGWKNRHMLAIQVISSDPSQTQVIQNRYCFAILLWLFVDRSAIGLPAYSSVQLFLLPIKFSKCWMTFMVVIVQAAAAGFLQKLRGDTRNI